MLSENIQYSEFVAQNLILNLHCNSAIAGLQQCNGGNVLFEWRARANMQQANQSRLPALEKTLNITPIPYLTYLTFLCKYCLAKMDVPIYMLKGNEMDILNDFSNKCCLKTQHRQEEFYIYIWSICFDRFLHQIVLVHSNQWRLRAAEIKSN